MAMRGFVEIDLGREPAPDETTVRRFVSPLAAMAQGGLHRTDTIPAGMSWLLRPQPVARAAIAGRLEGWISWIHQHLHCVSCVVWVQRKTRGQRYRELHRLNVSECSASAAVFSPRDLDD
jgi:hypothetical protein